MPLKHECPPREKFNIFYLTEKLFITENISCILTKDSLMSSRENVLPVLPVSPPKSSKALLSRQYHLQVPTNELRGPNFRSATMNIIHAILVLSWV